MQQFLVPQFLDVEPKIIGPVTIRQFVIMMVCLLVEVVLYKLFDFSLFIIVGLITFAVFGVFAFLRVNSRPFHYFILSLIQSFQRPKLRVWNKELSEKELKARRQPAKLKENVIAERFPVKQVRASRLSELSLIMNTGGVYKPEDENEFPPPRNSY